VGLHHAGSRANPPVRGGSRVDAHRRAALSLRPQSPTGAFAPRSVAATIVSGSPAPVLADLILARHGLAGGRITPHVRVPFNAIVRGVPRLPFPSKGIA
jgi:hypothetical protein